MYKTIKIYSIAALTALALIGCGGSDTGQSTTTAATVKKFSEGAGNLTDAEKLAYAVANQNKVPTGTENRGRTRALQRDDCTNGGTMEMEFDPQNPTYLSMTFHDCTEEGEVSNGTMKLDEMDENGEPGRITFVTNFIVTGAEHIFVKKGSTMEMTNEGSWEKLTINLEMTINGVTRGGENLIYMTRDMQDGSYIEFPLSGKEKIGNSAYFTVDPAYDASKTPFHEDANGNLLKGGRFRYKDSQNHKVELEVTDTNIVTVRVDGDGDGRFSDDEVSAIAIAE